MTEPSLRTNKLNRDLTVFSADGFERGEHELDRPNGNSVRAACRAPRRALRRRPAA